jgi:hypothetical protein
MTEYLLLGCTLLHALLCKRWDAATHGNTNLVLQVDFEAPKDYKEPQRVVAPPAPPPAAAAGSKATAGASAYRWFAVTRQL